MINEIYILPECYCCNFPCYPGEKSAGLLCVVSYHHEVVVKLGEYGFNSFSESLICPRLGCRFFWFQPVWNFRGDIDSLKKIFPDLCTEIFLVTKHHAVIVFPSHIIEIMYVMDTCGYHVIGMDDTTYSTDCMEFIAVVM